MLSFLRSHALALLQERMSCFVNSIAHFVTPFAWSVSIDETPVHFIGIVQVHVEIPYRELWRPAVLVRFQNDIALCFEAISLVDEMKCFGIICVLFWAGYWSLRTLTDTTHLPLSLEPL